MKTYYIEIEGYCSTVLALVKVEATNIEDAKRKAMAAYHANEDVYEISEEEARTILENKEIDYMIDEDGSEIDIDEN